MDRAGILTERGSLMKYWLWGIVLGILCGGAWADDAYREFTNTQGQSIRGRVLSFDAVKGVVQIEAENGKKARIPLAGLVEKDQEYIQAWGNAQNFMNESRFRISANRNREKNEGKSGQQGVLDRDVKNVGYDITLDNRSDIALANIQLEYCIFYEQEDFKAGADKAVCEQGIYCGTLDVDGIPARSDKVLQTAEVIVFKEELDSGYYYTSGRPNVKHGQVHGVWLRASIALPNGERVFRDYCLPDSLPSSKTWTTKTVAVGMNK